ncbi:MAG: hypothetical protein AVDCRST_MAG21-1667, partial [uncultured Nocardioidaceae bacterium]
CDCPVASGPVPQDAGTGPVPTCAVPRREGPAGRRSRPPMTA